MTKTEHPKLFIYEAKYNMFFENDVRSNGEIVNLDMFTYMNSKFVYVEKHFRAQIKDLYLNILREKCEVDKEIIRNSLSIASILPDEFAHNLMKKPGYIARIAGEAVHIIKCTPVEVKLLHTDKCYTQLPVTSGNKTWFLTPKTHILLKTGLQINCNSIIPQYYKIGRDWINLMPEPRKTERTIQVIKPEIKTYWEPEKLDSLASSGIYSQEDLQKLQEHIMFPIEKESLLNTIARGMQGEENVQAGLINNLFTENTLWHIAESTWDKFMKKIISFGSISSAIIMVLIIINIVKTAIDMIIRGYTLHTLYGWSIKLLAAIFSSFTYLLVTLGTKKNKDNEQSRRKELGLKKTERQNQEETELQEIVIDKSMISKPRIIPPIPSTPPFIKQKNQNNPNLQNNNVSIFNLEPI